MTKNIGIVVVEPREKILPGQVKFWKFDQNNPGGSFHIDEDHAEDMWFEAVSAGDANHRAEMYGLRLDGDECPGCCGSRWYSQSGDWNAEEIPTVWAADGTKEGRKLPLVKVQLWLDSGPKLPLPWWAPGSWTKAGDPWAIVVHMDGKIVKYIKPDLEKIVVDATVGEDPSLDFLSPLELES